MFNSKYPIVAVGMNKVSDIRLALAVANAGGVATITGFNYLDLGYKLDLKALITDFELYNADQNTCNFIFSVDDRLLIKYPELLEIFDQYGIKYLELITTQNFVDNNFAIFDKTIDKIKQQQIKILDKLVSDRRGKTRDWLRYVNDRFDGVIVKGNDGAGRVPTDSNITLIELTKQCIKSFPGKVVIPCGGIGSATDVLELINAGADAVGVGTLFAASKESPLAPKAKEKLVASTYADVTKLTTTDLKQNALVFTDVEQTKENNTRGLVLGVRTGEQGHVFAGKGINNVNTVKSVKEIITDLCSLL